jgi:CubicO group peptidase (beta-lactamase class C family)
VAAKIITMKKYILAFFLFATLTLCCSQDIFIPWKVSSPEEQGLNSLTLINGIKQIKRDNINIHSFLVIRNDHLVVDTYFYPFKKEYNHDLASVTKSITALLIGIAIDKGYIKDEDQPAIQYFPEYKVKNDTLLKLKIKDLLNMSSGFRCSWNNGEQELKQMNYSGDWVKFMLDLPFESLPGTRFSYCSGNFYLLAEILQRTTGMSCHEFAEKYLFQPLDFGVTFWEKNDKGVNHGWGDLFMSAYDLAKIGDLILKDGRWNNKQIISREWIEKIKPLYRIQGTESYGYGWWSDSENPDEIQAVGRGGQRLFIFKEKNIIIAVTGGGFEAGDIDNLVLESVRSYDKHTNKSFSLDSISKMIQLPGHDQNVGTSYLPSGILNKEFLFDKNDLNIRSVRFEQRNKDSFIAISYTDGSRDEHPFGMDNEYIVTNGRKFNLPVALKGKWENNNLVLYYNELCGINLLKLSFTFSDSSVDLIIQDQTDGWIKSLKGRE